MGGNQSSPAHSIIQACRDGDESRLRRILDSNPSQDDLLHICSKSDHPDCSDQHDFAIHICCNENRPRLLRLLLKAINHLVMPELVSAVVRLLNAYPCGNALVHFNLMSLTAWKGSADCLQELLEFRPALDVDYRRTDGLQIKSALFEACGRGNAACVRMLLRHGARLHFPDQPHASPLLLAMRSENAETISLLLDASQSHPVGQLYIDATNSDGESSLHLAAGRGNAGILRRLLKAKPPPLLDIQSNRGLTALMIACEPPEFRDSDGQRASCVSALLSAQLPADLYLQDKRGRTALHCFPYGQPLRYPDLMHAFVAVLQAVDAHAPDLLSYEDNEGLTPLHVAALAGNEEAALMMVNPPHGKLVPAQMASLDDQPILKAWMERTLAKATLSSGNRSEWIEMFQAQFEGGFVEKFNQMMTLTDVLCDGDKV